MWLNCSYSKQCRDHNDNSRTTTMKLEREDRFDKPEAVDSMKWIDSYSRLSPWNGHGTRILRPTRVRDYGTKDFPHIYVARMQILISRCIPDEFTIFFPLYDNVHVSTCEICDCVTKTMPDVESRSETVCFTKRFSRCTIISGEIRTSCMTIYFKRAVYFKS